MSATLADADAHLAWSRLASAGAAWRTLDADLVAGHPLVWRSRILLALSIATANALLGWALAGWMHTDLKSIWTQADIDLGYEALFVLALLLSSLWGRQQIRFPIGELPWRRHLALTSLNVLALGAILAGPQVFVARAGDRVSAALPATSLSREIAYFRRVLCIPMQNLPEQAAIAIDLEELRSHLAPFGMTSDGKMVISQFAVASGAPQRWHCVSANAYLGDVNIWFPNDKIPAASSASLRLAYVLLTIQDQQALRAQGALWTQHPKTFLVALAVGVALLAALSSTGGRVRRWCAALPFGIRRRDAGRAPPRFLSGFDRRLLTSRPCTWAVRPHVLCWHLICLTLALSLGVKTMAGLGSWPRDYAIESSFIFEWLVAGYAIVFLIRRFRAYKIPLFEIRDWCALSGVVLAAALPAAALAGGMLLSDSSSSNDESLLLALGALLSITASASIATGLANSAMTRTAWSTLACVGISIVPTLMILLDVLIFGAFFLGLWCALAAVVGWTRRSYGHLRLIRLLAVAGLLTEIILLCSGGMTLWVYSDAAFGLRSPVPVLVVGAVVIHLIFTFPMIKVLQEGSVRPGPT